MNYIVGEHQQIPSPTPDSLRRLVKHINTDGECWTWKGLKDKRSGYGIMSIGGRTYRAHRVAYTWLYDSIPIELTLDHLCKNTSCVNPGHLQPVSLSVNSSRNTKSHCIRGHEFTPENSYVHPQRGGRHCRKCMKLNALKYREMAKLRKGQENRSERP